MPLRFSTKPSPSAPWARGLLSAFWEWRSPDLPACGLQRGSAVAQYGPSSLAHAQDAREGPSLAGWTTGGFLRGGLTRQAREEAERSRQGVPREVLMTQGMTIKTRRAPGGRQAGASLCSVLVSSLVQREQAHARSTEASSKGFHISATRPRPAEQQDGGHCGAQDGIITNTFGSQRLPLVRIACTSCPLSKWPLLDPFPLNIWGEDQGLYK